MARLPFPVLAPELLEPRITPTLTSLVSGLVAAALPVDVHADVGLSLGSSQAPLLAVSADLSLGETLGITLEAQVGSVSLDSPGVEEPPQPIIDVGIGVEVGTGDGGGTIEVPPLLDLNPPSLPGEGSEGPGSPTVPPTPPSFPTAPLPLAAPAVTVGAFPVQPSASSLAVNALLATALLEAGPREAAPVLPDHGSGSEETSTLAALEEVPVEESAPPAERLADGAAWEELVPRGGVPVVLDEKSGSGGDAVPLEVEEEEIWRELDRIELLAFESGVPVEEAEVPVAEELAEEPAEEQDLFSLGLAALVAASAAVAVWLNVRRSRQEQALDSGMVPDLAVVPPMP